MTHRQSQLLQLTVSNSNFTVNVTVISPSQEQSNESIPMMPRSINYYRLM
jgi:hypothetical protein